MRDKPKMKSKPAAKAKSTTFKPCKGCPSPAKCRAAKKCAKQGKR